MFGAKGDGRLSHFWRHHLFHFPTTQSATQQTHTQEESVAMRTRSQISIWAQAKQLAQQNAPVSTQHEPVRKSPQPRKRKLTVATTTKPASSAVDGRKSILDFVSSNVKKAKLGDAIIQLDATTQQQQQNKLAMAAFNTPLKKPTLCIDTNAAPMKENEVIALVTQAQSELCTAGERKLILDYISPNSKNARGESDRRAAADATADEPQTTASPPSIELKRPVICRTLSYGSEEVLSDSTVDNLDSEPMPLAPATNDSAEYVLQRVCGSRTTQRKLPIVGREAEQATIASVLNGADVDRQRSLFIIGPPGTGKSSSVDQLLAEYERRSPMNAVIRLNCSTYTNPIALYAEIDAQLRMLTAWKLPYFDPCFLDDFLQAASRTRTKCET